MSDQQKDLGLVLMGIERSDYEPTDEDWNSFGEYCRQWEKENFPDEFEGIL